MNYQCFDPAVRTDADGGVSFPIQGYCAPGFESVLEAFRENFTPPEGQVKELGASVCVIREDKVLVDLWGGYTNGERSHEWAADTLVAVRSTSKGLCGIVANLAADRGEIDLDAPIADYWPEFATAGKAQMPVRYILDHRAGLPVLDDPLWPGAIFDWKAMTDALAAQKPLWTPGEKAGYHTFTQGFLIGEVIRRVTGKTIGQYARSEVAEPLEADFYIGLQPDEEARCAEFQDVVAGTVYDPKSSPSPFALKLRAQFPSELQANRAQWRRAEIPSSNGHANARGLARTYAGLLGLGGKRLLSEAAIERMRAVQHDLHEMVGNRTIRQGMGVIVNSPPWAYFGPEKHSFGSQGFGGSLAMADPVNRLTIGYAMNQPHLTLSTGERSRRLVDATYRSLGK